MTELTNRIDHVVFIVKENHTFDNYFGTFTGANGVQLERAQNPPSGDPDHKHETWEQRANETRYRVQYAENDIPGYFALARQYTLCDNYFSEVAGPSTPNHLMLICASHQQPSQSLSSLAQGQLQPALATVSIREGRPDLGQLRRVRISLHRRAQGPSF